MSEEATVTLRAALVEMVEAYGASWVRIRERLAEIGQSMAEDRRRGKAVSVFWLHEADRLNGVLDLTRAEFSRFAQFAEQQIVEQQRAAVQAAGGEVHQLTLDGLGPAPPGAFVSLTRLDTTATESLVGFLGDGSPLNRLLGQLPVDASALVSSELITGVSTGASITNIARRIRHGLGGNMVRALTIARTEVLRAQREASRLTMMQNEHVLEGWIWHSALSKNTCAACYAMHGTVHKVEERLDGHPRCRCTRVPKTKSWEELGFPGAPDTSAHVPKGVDLFEKLPEEDQDKILGKAAGLAYRAGAVKLPQFVGRKRSKQWGTMRYTRSLQTILGSEARQWKDAARAAHKRTFPAGSRPVSTAIIARPGLHRRAVLHAVASIDEVHIDGDLPDTPAWPYGKLGPGVQGFYTVKPTAKGTKDRIRLASSASHPELTSVHEIGHLLDLRAFGAAGIPGSHRAPELQSWRDAVIASRAPNRIMSLLYGVASPHGGIVSTSVDHVDYLLQPHELFARSYAQYIALRSSSPILKQQISDLQVKQVRHGVDTMEQWVDADFQDIAQAFDEIFEARGWLIH